MATRSNHKFKFFYVMKIMLEYTDEEHYLTLSELMEKLTDYEITAERKSLYQDLNDLEMFGITVESIRNGKNTCYHVIEKPFELHELKLLVDSIQSSKFLTVRKTNELIKKLETQCSIYERMKLDRQVFIQDRIKTMNETVYYSLDSINAGISENHTIRFQYFNWDINKQMQLKHDGSFYEVSPLALTLEDGNYYLIAYDEKTDMIKHFRVDKMLRISVTENERKGVRLFPDFDIANYVKKNFFMFKGEEQYVNIRLDNSKAGIFIDRFGKNIDFLKVDESTSELHLKVALSPHFFSWLFALGEGIKIVGPESALESAKKYIANIQNSFL